MSKKIKATGSCLCGAVKVTANEMSTGVGACHCGMCRKWGGGPLMAVDCGQAVVFDGEDHIKVYHSSDWAERGFCSQCGSHLFYRLKGTGQTIMSAGLFEDQNGFNFDHQVFIDNKPDYYSFRQQTHDMTEAEVFAKYGDSTDD